jgi:hypothetical protein
MDGDVVDEIKIELIVQRRVYCGGRIDSEKRITVGRGTHDSLGSNIAGGTWPVLDDKCLTEPLGQRLTDQA